LTDRKHILHIPLTESDDRHLRITTQSLLRQMIRVTEGRSSQPYLLALIHPAHALPRLFHDASKRRFRQGGARQGCGDRMMARKREPAGEIEHFLWDIS